MGREPLFQAPAPVSAAGIFEVFAAAVARSGVEERSGRR
jgi:hypothetical protein